jgi:hypothetical protein
MPATGATFITEMAAGGGRMTRFRMAIRSLRYDVKSVQRRASAKPSNGFAFHRCAEFRSFRKYLQVENLELPMALFGSQAERHRKTGRRK